MKYAPSHPWTSIHSRIHSDPALLFVHLGADDFPPGLRQAEPRSATSKVLSLCWQTRPKSDTLWCSWTSGHVPALPSPGHHFSFLHGLKPCSSGSTPVSHTDHPLALAPRPQHGPQGPFHPVPPLRSQRMYLPVRTQRESPSLWDTVLIPRLSQVLQS